MFAVFKYCTECSWDSLPETYKQSEYLSADTAMLSELSVTKLETPKEFDTAIEKPPEEFDTTIEKPPEELDTAIKNPPDEFDTAIENPPDEFDTAIENPPDEFDTAIENPPDEFDTAIEKPEFMSVHREESTCTSEIPTKVND